MTGASSDKAPLFERKAYSALKEWKERSRGRTAMLIEGARRVGKSTLAEEFARNEYRSYVLIDFSEENKDISASATGICVSSEVITESGRIFVCPTS